MSLVLIDTIFDNRFRILSELGSGGFGTVYKAEQTDLGRVVALKVLNADSLLDPKQRDNFRREAKLLSGLHHINIVEVYSFGISPEGLPYIAMEFVAGNTLASQILKREKLDEANTLNIALQICQAMTAMHKAGMIHRDLKPQNIVVLDSSVGDLIKILDFGLTKALSMEQEGSQAFTKTRTGNLVGSPHYMSPETCNGAKVDERSDVYSSACILYECLSGNPPFMADTAMGVLYKQCNERPLPFAALSPPVKVSSELEAIIFKSLEKDPKRRYQSAEEMQRDLSLVQAGNLAELNLERAKPISKRAKNSMLQASIVCAIILSCLALIASIKYREEAAVSREKLRTQAKPILKIHGSNNSKLRIVSDALGKWQEYEHLAELESAKIEIEKIIAEENSRKQANNELLYIAYLLKGNICKRLNEPSEAAQSFIAAYAVCTLPNGKMALEATLPLLSSARLALENNRFSEAEQSANEALSIHGNSKSIFPDLGSYSIVTAMPETKEVAYEVIALSAYKRKKNWAEAENLMSKARAFSASLSHVNQDVELAWLDIVKQNHGVEAATNAAMQLFDIVKYNHDDMNIILEKEVKGWFAMENIEQIRFLWRIGRWLKENGQDSKAAMCFAKAKEVKLAHALSVPEKMKKDLE